MTVTTPAAMRSSKQVGFQQHNGEQQPGYTDGTGGEPFAPPQGSNPAQQSRNSTSTEFPERVPYRGQKLHSREYVDDQGYVMKKKKSRRVTLAQHAAAHVAVFLCCAWLCTAPCHCCCCV